MSDRDYSEAPQSQLFRRAVARIPGGVNSPVRAFGAVGGQPFFAARAEGPAVWDTEGRRYLDLVQSWGASILGHADPDVVEAVIRAARAGTSYGILNRDAICDRYVLGEASNVRVCS